MVVHIYLFFFGIKTKGKDRTIVFRKLDRVSLSVHAKVDEFEDSHIWDRRGSPE